MQPFKQLKQVGKSIRDLFNALDRSGDRLVDWLTFPEPDEEYERIVREIAKHRPNEVFARDNVQSDIEFICQGKESDYKIAARAMLAVHVGPINVHAVLARAERKEAEAKAEAPSLNKA